MALTPANTKKELLRYVVALFTQLFDSLLTNFASRIRGPLWPLWTFKNRKVVSKRCQPALLSVKTFLSVANKRTQGVKLPWSRLVTLERRRLRRRRLRGCEFNFSFLPVFLLPSPPDFSLLF